MVKNTDQYYMKIALEEAQKAYKKKEVPIGAIVVKNGEVISRGHNLRETLNDPTAHAEIIVIKKAAIKLGGWRLSDCRLYVTIEPCPMCAGALVQSRVKSLIYGASDPKAGAAGSIINIVDFEEFNHKLEFKSGVLENECSKLMKKFFKELRT
jgi:tRNA(adenine34) deaminase